MRMEDKYITRKTKQTIIERNTNRKKSNDICKKIPRRFLKKLEIEEDQARPEDEDVSQNLGLNHNIFN